ncbi:MAG: UTP--glucose-1-phosphate uridylyltransferase [Pseudomonadota bacterium]
MTKVRTAVFPVAGLGTRFLPATKAVPKELMPVVDRPVLQYAVEEAKAAGVENFVFVNSWGKGALEDHFDRNLGLEQALEAKGKDALLKAARDCALPSGAMTVVRQHAPLGLGHAVWCARHVVGDEPFAVLLPDEVLRNDPPCLAAMAAAYEGVGGAMLAVVDVPRAETKKYGIIDPAEGADPNADVIAMRGMVEKPDPEQAPTTLAAIGRYILSPDVMRALDETKPGAGGEIQLTDAIAACIGKTPVSGWRYTGERFDCGSVAGFVRANLAFALDRPELAAEIQAELSLRGIAG